MTNTENSKQKRALVLGYPVDLFQKEEALAFAAGFLQRGENLHIVTINPEIILAAEKNPELDAIIKKAGLLIPDSIGMEIALRYSGCKEAKNAKKMAGIEFSESLVKICAENGYNIAFIGGTQEVIEKLQREMEFKFPDIKVVYARNGYFGDEEAQGIIEELKKVSPHLILAALGSPKQDYFINNCMNELSGAVMIGVGGSFDVWAKKVKRAPVIFRMFGLEWFYRLITQPSRFSRMFPALPLFIVRAVLTRK